MMPTLNKAFSRVDLDRSSSNHLRNQRCSVEVITELMLSHILCHRQGVACLPVWGNRAAAPEDCIVSHCLCLALVPEATTCLVLKQRVMQSNLAPMAWHTCSHLLHNAAGKGPRRGALR